MPMYIYLLSNSGVRDYILLGKEQQIIDYSYFLNDR